MVHIEYRMEQYLAEAIKGNRYLIISMICPPSVTTAQQ